MYICIYVYVYIYIYVWMYVYMYICIYVYMYICDICDMCIYICMYVCIYMYICIYICIYKYMYVYMYVYMCVCMYVCMYVCIIYIMFLTCMVRSRHKSYLSIVAGLPVPILYRSLPWCMQEDARAPADFRSRIAAVSWTIQSWSHGQVFKSVRIITNIDWEKLTMIGDLNVVDLYL